MTKLQENILAIVLSVTILPLFGIGFLYLIGGIMWMLNLSIN